MPGCIHAPRHAAPHPTTGRLARMLLRAATAAALCPWPAAGHAAPPAVVLRTDDVDRFYRVYDAAQGRPDATALQSGYIDPGSPALHEFVVARLGSAARLAEAVARRPADYVAARACLPALDETRTQLPAVFARMQALVPDATFPPVTFVVGRLSTGGTTTPQGITIGLEVMCGARQTGTDIGARLTHLVAHELAHIQQPAARTDAPPEATLLFQSLVEGGAELLAELTSGEVANVHLKTWTRGRECAIEQAFAAAAMGRDVSHWLYNGVGTPAAPGDLGYWVGYRIAQSYYEHARDKHQAVAELLHVDNDNAAALLARSGWQPSTDCADAP